MDKRSENVPLIYLYIYKKLVENTKRFKIIPYRVLISEFSQRILIRRIPRKYFDIIIKELIDFKLMEKVSKGKSPTYKISHKDYKNKINELKSLEKSGLRFKILKDKYKKFFKELEQIEDLTKRYNLLKCDYEKQLRKLELKKLKEYHYW